MTQSATDVIVSRSQRQEQLMPMVFGSMAIHAAVIALLVVFPYGTHERPVREVMSISLGGATGPSTGGLTQIGGRPVQAVAPPEPRRIEPPAAPEPPKMTLPEPKPRPKAPPEPRKAPADAPARTPATGSEVTEGSTPVDTGARGAGFGLSSAGGVGGDLQLDVSDFCCPEYLNVIVASITRNWRQDQGRAGSCVVKFTIHRNGRIDSVTVDRPSGHYPLDAAAQRAVQLTQLPPLPAGFSNPTLTVHMTFRY